MKLSQKKRREVIRSINAAIADFNDDGKAEHLRRISRMVANLNGVAWPE